MLRHLVGHEVRTAYEMGWSQLKNGALLDSAQLEFDVLVTVDQNVPYQQNLAERSIAVVVLIAPNNRIETLEPLASELLQVLQAIQPGYINAVPRNDTDDPEAQSTGSE